MSTKFTEIDGRKFRFDHYLITEPVVQQLLNGDFELYERRLGEKYFSEKLPIIDLGAGIGVASCTLNKKRHGGMHMAVEANPEIYELLCANRDLNDCSFHCINKLVGYNGTQSRLYLDKDFLGCSIFKVGDKFLEIETITLRQLVDFNKIEKAQMLCDVEGGERDIIQNDIDILGNNIKTLIIEFHDSLYGKDVTQMLVGMLECAGFVLLEKRGRVCAMDNINI